MSARKTGLMKILPGILCTFALCMAACSAPSAGELMQQRMQGTWLNTDKQSNTQISIFGDSLYYFQHEGAWYEAKIAFPPDTKPQQMLATITDSAPLANDIGTVVLAIIDVSADTLFIGMESGGDKLPENWVDAFVVYAYKKVRLQNCG